VQGWNEIVSPSLSISPLKTYGRNRYYRYHGEGTPLVWWMTIGRTTNQTRECNDRGRVWSIQVRSNTPPSSPSKNAPKGEKPRQKGETSMKNEASQRTFNKSTTTIMHSIHMDYTIFCVGNPRIQFRVHHYWCSSPIYFCNLFFFPKYSGTKISWKGLNFLNVGIEHVIAILLFFTGNGGQYIIVLLHLANWTYIFGELHFHSRICSIM